ncbi:SH3 domain-containing protein [Bacillus sp. KH172YL63]|uniref:SH3 domain-containing protein n=1 Tax=Bacillus sp. KH172YL63 TaxID=2709784 RepID=UPI0013E5101C|nr:SH3 domain-containing protein [Bacillus sp. KH172YL63]BCB04951.1 putative N-acetylmuramoyl-L-alanine amidase YrvJ [Bacillus sp. KH172YL63]
MKKLIASLLILLLIAPVQPGAPAHAESGGVTISVSTLNVRTGPGLSYPVLTKVHRGESYNIVDTDKEWYKIRTEAGDGWVADWLVSADTVSTGNPSTKEEGTVNTDGLRMRKGPSTADQVITVLDKGDAVTVTGKEGDWLKIESGNTSGWVHREYITGGVDTQASSSRRSENKQGIITDNALNVRKSPSIQSSVLGVLNRGDQVEVTGSVSGWYEIAFGDTKAWISERYVEFSSGGGGANANPPAERGDASTELLGIITVHGLNVRDETSLNGKVIGKVSKGERFKLLKEDNNWYQIKLDNGKKGWIAGWYVQKTMNVPSEGSRDTDSSENLTILYNGTNIRSSATTQSSVIERASSGDSFPVVSKDGDWVEIQLADGRAGWVAGWVTSIRSAAGENTAPARERKGGLQGKVIVIDPGHGGRDSGTTGASGTLEKLLTMKTGELLAEKLKSAGAKVVLTRKTDEYLSLPSRVSLSHYYEADAFISIHFDSIMDSSVAGHTTYYYRSQQKELAEDIHGSLSARLPTSDRGARVGDYHVIRENNRPAVLLELGFLSNPTEEANVNTQYFQDLASTAIYHGLGDYFSN